MKMIILVLFIFITSSCSLSVDDLVKDAKEAQEFGVIREARAIDLERKYLNADQSRVLADLGKPKYANDQGFSYLVDRNCHGSECVSKKADQMWVYEFFDQYKDDKIFYTHNIYFVDGKVVAIY